MLTKIAVIQKIDAGTRSVHVHQSLNIHSSWSFETRASAPENSGNEALFPFVFRNADRFSEEPAGAETKIRFTSDDRILFADDYGVPGQIIIGILFPKGYVPEVFKFKAKPFIPTGVGFGSASLSPPGHFDVFTNSEAKLSAVVFWIHDPTYFGFKCLAVKRDEDYPRSARSPFLNDLYATLGADETHPINVTIKDVEEFSGHFRPSVNLEEVAETINRLSQLSAGESRRDMIQAQTLAKRFQGALSNTASAVQLSDSYLSGGTVARLIAYFTM